MRLFRRKKEESKPPRHEFYDIPIGSMVELSDTTTFALEEKTTETFEVKAYKKYEADDFLRYMYQLLNGDEIILGVDFDPGSMEYDLARFVIDSEEEFTEPLGDTIVMSFNDPNNEGEVIDIEYHRDEVFNTKMTVVTGEGSEDHYDVELQEYSADDGTLLLVELWDSWFTFYLGEIMEKSDANVFPINLDEDE
ncbi:DUF4178 domain-containing protein [Candidatus Poribacteria bacterium]|nr:DUF4178 domain-containing protein [Candidatus Poribacteria bacterium]